MVSLEQKSYFMVIYRQVKEGLIVTQTSEVVNLQNIWFCILKKTRT